MATLTTGKIAEVLFENAIENFESQMDMLGLTDRTNHDSAALQNSGNFVWKTVNQQRPSISGWDVTGSEQGIIEETYPCVLGTPENDIVELRLDDMRDLAFWQRAGVASGKKQASILNKAIADKITNTGSLFYRSNADSGYDFIAECQAMYNERQLSDSGRIFMLTDRDALKFSKDLAGRQTVQGRPDKAWATGQIGANVAGFDVYTGSFLSNLAGGADPATTVTADVSFAPTAGSVSATGVVTNVDYRVATIAVTSSASYAVGDRVTFANSGTTVKAVGKDDKTNTGQAMTFVIVAKPDGTSVQIYPKPIAANDSGLSTLEKAYANINTQILNGATMNRVNTDTSAKPSIFWDKDSIEVMTGEAPVQLFNQFAGMKTISSTMKNGQKMYMVYDGNAKTMKIFYRLFTWYGITNRNPSANGIAVAY